MSNKKIKELSSKLFESREMAHIFHLQRKSYSTHMALQTYYESVIDFIDEFIETYQGQYEIIEGYNEIIPSKIEKTDPIKYFQEVAEYISNSNAINKKDTHLQNILDEIVALIYKTLYKLKYLK